MIRENRRQRRHPADRHLRIEPAHGVARRPAQRFRRPIGSDQHRELPDGKLAGTHVDRRCRRQLQTLEAFVFDDADDGEFRGDTRVGPVEARRIRANRPIQHRTAELVRERLVDEDGTRGAEIIAFGQRPPVDHRDVHRRKIPGADDPQLGGLRRVIWTERGSGEGERAAPVGLERMVVSKGDGARAREARQVAGEAAFGGDDRPRIAVGVTGERDVGDQHAVDGEPGVLVTHRVERLLQQRCRGDQADGDRDLRHDQETEDRAARDRDVAARRE